MSIATLQEIPTIFSQFPVGKHILDRISIWKGDITKIKVDAIVNAANKELAGGGGVDGVIHRAAGTAVLQNELKKYSGCPVGKSVITSGCNINHIKNIIHTVGPQYYSSPNKEEHRQKLISCYQSCLDLAIKHNLNSVAFCCISTGVYGYPNNEAAETVTKFLINFLETNRSIERIVLVTFLNIDKELYESEFSRYANSLNNC